MATGLAEDADEQIGAAVDDLRLVGEAADRIDEAAELDDAGDPVEITAGRGPDPGEQIQAAEPRRLDRVFDQNIAADLRNFG